MRSFSHHLGTDPWDSGTLPTESASKASSESTEKSLLVASHLTTESSTHQEWTTSPPSGTPKDRSRPPPLRTNILTSLAEWELPRSQINHTTSLSLGTDLSRSGTSSVFARPPLLPTRDQSMPWTSTRTDSTSSPEERTEESRSGSMLTSRTQSKSMSSMRKSTRSSSHHKSNG